MAPAVIEDEPPGGALRHTAILAVYLIHVDRVKVDILPVQSQPSALTKCHSNYKENVPPSLDTN